jgi:hypothetical protein
MPVRTSSVTVDQFKFRVESEAFKARQARNPHSDLRVGGTDSEKSPRIFSESVPYGFKKRSPTSNYSERHVPGDPSPWFRVFCRALKLQSRDKDNDFRSELE